MSVQELKSAQASPSPSPAPVGPAVQLKQALAGRSLDVQLSMLTPRAVQKKGDDTVAVHEAAASGIASGGGALPHADKIQASFGSHDVGNVQAHTGAAAQDASSAMGAEAYATGNHVVLGGGADLHTVAHEAAHVVQQQAGVSLSGGVGQVGDKYEQHADKVADAVVQGKSAEPILNEMTGAGPGVQRRAIQRSTNPFFGKVQRLAGDLSAPVRSDVAPGMVGQTVGQAAAALHPEARDASFNPLRKVEFETRLAQLILGTPDAFMTTVRKVSNGVLDYIEAEAAAGLSNANASMVALINEGQGFFGRWVEELTEQNQNDIAADMKRTLRGGGGGAAQHLMMHAKFNWEIYSKNWQDQVKQAFMTQFISKNKNTAKPPGGEGSLRNDAQVTVGGSTASNLFDKANRGRIEAGKPGASVTEKADTSSRATGTRSQQGGAEAESQRVLPNTLDADKEAIRGSHDRGTNSWTVDETAAFCQQARLLLNMPLSGGGPSGTTSDCLTIGIAFGAASPQERLEYALAVQGVLSTAGAHTFHEIMTIAATIGVPYQPGSYAGVYPDSFGPRVAQLKREFPDLFPDGQNLAQPGTNVAPPVAAPTTQPVT